MAMTKASDPGWPRAEAVPFPGSAAQSGRTAGSASESKRNFTGSKYAEGRQFVMVINHWPIFGSIGLRIAELAFAEPGEENTGDDQDVDEAAEHSADDGSSQCLTLMWVLNFLFGVIRCV